MKLLIDFFPIILFFAAFKLWGIYTATAVAIAATVLQIGYLRYKNGKVEPMQWVSLGVIVVFGGATLLSHSETFIKWKPTVLYWLMGSALLIGQVFFRKNLIRSLMGAQMELPDAAWRTVNWSWTGFFAVMGLVNLWVAYHFDTDTWVNFKLFGGIGLMAVFVIGQALYLSRYMKEDETKTAPKDVQP
ncbi:septation protein A [Acidovorax sp. NCPPB 3576]|uniref:septation protein A n=1 Tax=Acidovorax sp. NCPPB 3576 TaxID=2940488 RepID=UPI00234B2D67|nr:septation protein A [Acidovorax sp. NCPPB 3576]WCM86445.1 septation protein A [Acidovorax sp. NCPPB 3576]